MPEIANCTIAENGSGYKAEANEGFALFRVEQYQRWLDRSTDDPIAYPPESLYKYVRFFKRVYLSANSNGSLYDTMAITDEMIIV